MRWSLPDQQGPLIGFNRPAANSTVTSSMARTAVSPEPYTLVAFSARAMAARGGASVFVIWDLLGSRRDDRRDTGPRSRRPGGGFAATPSGAVGGAALLRAGEVSQPAQPGRTGPDS